MDLNCLILATFALNKKLGRIPLCIADESMCILYTPEIVMGAERFLRDIYRDIVSNISTPYEIRCRINNTLIEHKDKIPWFSSYLKFNPSL